LSQGCIELSQFHPFPNDDLVQQQRLPTGSNTLIARVVVGAKRQERNVRYVFNNDSFGGMEANFDEVDEV